MREIVIHQMLLFFAVFLIGMLCVKQNILRRESLPHLAGLMAKVLLPVMIFSISYFGVTWAMVRQNAVVLLITAGFYLIVSGVMFLTAMAASVPMERRGVFCFAFIFGNTGFVGAPLLAALLPETGRLSLALFSIVDQLLFWTYGVWLASDDKIGQRFSLKRFLNPNLIAITLALVFVAARVQLPKIAEDVLLTLKNAVPAVSMLYLGALFACSDWKTAFRSRELYFGIAVKMLLLPILLGKLLTLTALPAETVSAMVILMALPTMTVVPMIAETYGREGAYASGITPATLAASIVTIPVVFSIVCSI